MEEIKLDAFNYALSIIDNGWIFENFAKSFISAVLNYEFIPVGGVKDRGIDGLNHVFVRKGFDKIIFQISTEKDEKGKIKATIQKLSDNAITYDSLTYVSNRDIRQKDKLIDNIYEEHGVQLRVFDLSWFATNANASEGTRNAYYTYVKNNMQEFNKPGKSFVVSDIETDSRIFVFLRQQLESKYNNFKIDDLLADSLVLFALEGTDPDKQIFKSRDEIKNAIREYVKFDPKLLESVIDRRLDTLSTKPRKIHFHKDTGYCLPYETRFEIAQRNMADEQLIQIFYEQTGEVIKKYLQEKHTSIKDLTKLIDSVIHKIFHQQGLEFSNFVLHGKSQKSIEKDLQDVINNVVDDSTVIEKNKEVVKTCLLVAVREIVYSGTEEQRRYFRSLSNTYMMMFLLQWNPQVALYFESMASKLNIYVCTSIIIPAFSEYYLDNENKRHWNLLKSAYQVGIRLYITDGIVNELISHLRMIKSKYESIYQFNEDIYLGNDLDTLFIDEILIRAYFYAKSRNRVDKFNDFLDNFCDHSLKNIKEELIDYLRNQFGLIYKSDSSLKLTLNKGEQGRLSEKLIKQGKHPVKAQTDAKIILTIFKLREKHNEMSSSGIYGYRTWWLSKDTSTYKAVQTVFKNKFPISCYMRPDFLYNHIALAPKKVEVDAFYKEIFPSLLGVNLSFHLPKEVTEYVHRIISDHSTKDPSRVKAIVRKLSEKLKTDPTARNISSVKLYLDEELKSIRGVKKGNQI